MSVSAVWKWLVGERRVTTPHISVEPPPPGGHIKALTVWQPYADLIVAGERTIELRHKATSYRGPIAIHAAKNLSLCGDKKPTDVVFRAVIGIVDLIDCQPALHGARADKVTDSFIQETGPWEWVLANPRVLRPCYCDGSLGLWDWRMTTQAKSCV